MSLEKTGTLFRARAFVFAGSDGFKTSIKSSIQILKQREELQKSWKMGRFWVTVFCHSGKTLVSPGPVKAGRFSRF
jgi:hypothetical protein